MANSIFLVYNIVTTALAGMIFLYAGYWAFSIRSALAVRLYRNQALGIALVGLSIGLVIISGSILTYITGNTLTYISGNVLHYVRGLEQNIPYVGFFIIYVPFLIGFYAIDATLQAARRTDPLLRDTLGWSRLRIVLWAANIGGVSANLLRAIYLQIATGSIPAGTVSSNWALTVIQTLYTATPYFVPTISGVVLLPIAVRRSGDSTLRRHIKWFELFVFFVLVFYLSIPLLFIDPVQVLSIQFAGLVVGAYFLFRSARALAPLNRLSLVD